MPSSLQRRIYEDALARATKRQRESHLWPCALVQAAKRFVASGVDPQRVYNAAIVDVIADCCYDDLRDRFARLLRQATGVTRPSLP